VKRAYAVLILAILLANSGGFYVYYIVHLQQIKSEMREGLHHLPDHKLEVLTLSLNEYKEAQVDDDEIQVNGKMYDIARMKISRGSVKIFCIHDEKEDDLLALLSEIISKPIKRDGIPDAVLQFITLLYVAPPQVALFNTVANKQFFTVYYFSCKEAFEKTESPPPWPLG
jgi:hypothetical protein